MTLPSDEDDFAAGLAEDIGKALDDGTRPLDVETDAEEADAAEERSRYVREGSRFVKEAKPGVKEPAAGEEAKAAKDAVKEASPLWYKNEWGEWEKLNPDMRKAMAQREKDYAQGIEKHSTAAKAWEPVAQQLEPHAQELAAAGVNPQQYVSNLINADKYLRSNPVEATNWLVQQYLGQPLTAAGYSNDIMGLAQWMYDNNQQAQRPDPVQQELQALKQQVAQLAELPQRQQVDAVRTTVSEWSKDKPYFKDVERTIMGLIQADPGVRDRFRVDPTATLNALYDQATWAHPEIRERILRDQRTAETQRARAGVVTPRAGGPHGTQPGKQKSTRSLEDDLGEAFDAAGIT